MPTTIDLTQRTTEHRTAVASVLTTLVLTRWSERSRERLEEGWRDITAAMVEARRLYDSGRPAAAQYAADQAVAYAAPVRDRLAAITPEQLAMIQAACLQCAGVDPTDLDLAINDLYSAADLLAGATAETIAAVLAVSELEIRPHATPELW